MVMHHQSNSQWIVPLNSWCNKLIDITASQQHYFCDMVAPPARTSVCCCLSKNGLYIPLKLPYTLVVIIIIHAKWHDLIVVTSSLQSPKNTKSHVQMEPLRLPSCLVRYYEKDAWSGVHRSSYPSMCDYTPIQLYFKDLQETVKRC